MSLKARIERLEQQHGPEGEEACPECGTLPRDHFPIAFGELALCGTCGTLLLPPAEIIFPHLSRAHTAGAEP
jgi:hypothetical protein